MAEYNVIQKKRNADNTDWDTIYPVTTAENVMMGPGMGDIRGYTDKSSYMAFVANLNTDSLDAAFGKSNEDYISGLGNQLYRYSKFKNPEKIPDSLVNKNTLNDIFSDSSGIDDILDDQNYIDLINLSPYASSLIKETVPYTTMPPESYFGPIYQATPYIPNGGLMPTSKTLFGSLTVDKKGYYQAVAISFFMGGKYYLFMEVEVNGVVVVSYQGGYSTSGRSNCVLSKKLALKSGDVLKFYLWSNHSVSGLQTCSGLMLMGDIDVKPPIVTSGDIPIHCANSYTVKKKGAYKVSWLGFAYYEQTWSMDYRVNGVSVGTVETKGLQTVINCNENDVITISSTGGDTSSFGFLISSGDNPY